ncbi:MAG: helix-turn-helix transcriptional regulator [Terricaulis sp.]
MTVDLDVHAVDTPSLSAINAHIGRRLRRRRKLYGWTLQQLADATGVQYQQIHKYECGICRISAARLMQLATALKIPLPYFFSGLPGFHEGEENLETPEFDAPEVRDLINAYFALPKGARRKFVDLAKSFAPASV